MPRRLIESGIFVNEKVGNLTIQGRLLYIGIIVNADDDGRLKGSSKYLKALIFPYDNEITTEMVKDWRQQCQAVGLIQTYSLDGSEYITIPTWLEHQIIRKDRYRPSTIPAPSCQPLDNQMATNGQPPDNHLTTNDKIETTQPNDNQATTNGMRNIIKDNIIKDNIIKVDVDLTSTVGEKTKEVFAGIDKLRGYRPPKRKAEAASIIRMLKTYTPDQIIKTYEDLKQDKFWSDKELFMMTVESQIGAKLKDGGTRKAGGNPRAIPRPEQYTKPEDWKPQGI